MSRQKLPLKKVRIQQNNATSNPNRYQLNQRKLGFLPALFTGLIGLAILVAGIWYFDPFHQFRKSNSEVAGVQQTVQQLANQPPAQTNSTPVDSQKTDEVTQNQDENNVVLQSVNNQSCFISFQTQTPDGILPAVSKTPTGWWKIGKCADPSLQSIQIARLNDSEVQAAQAILHPENVQKIDDIDTYALAYTIDKQNTIYDLQPYVKSLTSPIFQDRYYFSEANAASTMRLNEVTYYLDGKCRGGGSDPCKLWRRNNTTGQLDLLKKNIADTGPGQTNELKSGIYLDFAANQDYEYGLNFILVQESTSQYKLVRIRLSDFQIIQSLILNPQDPEYKQYFK